MAATSIKAAKARTPVNATADATRNAGAGRKSTAVSTPTPMPRRAAADRPADKAKPAVKFRLRITTGDAIAVGPGKIALLEALDETGSITSAAKSLDMSYRRAWLLMSELNAALKQPAIESLTGGVAGGGSRLTAVGKNLVMRYRRVEQTAAQACAADLRELVKLIA